MLNIFTLKNGLKVATYSIPQMRSVYLDIAVKGGSLMDTPKKAGAAHFMEHILVQGTPSYPTVQEFSDYIESLAGSYNASTSNEIIKFYINLPANHLEAAIRIAGEVFFEALFTPESIEKERTAIFSEIKQSTDSLGYKVNKFFRETRYNSAHPIQQEILGTPTTVEKLTRNDLLEYWKKYFYPKNTYLVVVGQLDNQTAKTLIEKYFDRLKSKTEFPGFPEVGQRDFSNFKVAIRTDEKLNAIYLNLSAPSLVTGQSDIKQVVIQQILRSILGGLGASRLYKLLRHELGLVYHIGFSTGTWQRWGFVDSYTQVASEKLDQVLELMVKEIKSFLDKGPTYEELEFAKHYHINRTLMQFDHPSNIAGWISGDLLWEEKIYTVEEYAKLITDVKLAGLVDFMQKNWDFKRLNLTLQGPLENTQKNREKYSKMVRGLV